MLSRATPPVFSASRIVPSSSGRARDHSTHVPPQRTPLINPLAVAPAPASGRTRVCSRAPSLVPTLQSAPTPAPPPTPIFPILPQWEPSPSPPTVNEIIHQVLSQPHRTAPALQPSMQEMRRNPDHLPTPPPTQPAGDASLNEGSLPAVDVTRMWTSRDQARMVRLLADSNPWAQPAGEQRDKTWKDVHEKFGQRSLEAFKKRADACVAWKDLKNVRARFIVLYYFSYTLSGPG
jgi:hypothetical protein